MSVACMCEACAVIPAPTWTQAYRVACEVRQVMQWDKPTRADYFERVERSRGRKARVRLMDAVNREWAAQQKGRAL